MNTYFSEPNWTIIGQIMDFCYIVAIVLTAVVVDVDRDEVDCAGCAESEEIYQPLNHTNTSESMK